MARRAKPTKGTKITRATTRSRSRPRKKMRQTTLFTGKRPLKVKKSGKKSVRGVSGKKSSKRSSKTLKRKNPKSKRAKNTQKKRCAAKKKRRAGVQVDGEESVISSGTHTSQKDTMDVDFESECYEAQFKKMDGKVRIPRSRSRQTNPRISQSRAGARRR